MCISSVLLAKILHYWLKMYYGGLAPRVFFRYNYSMDSQSTSLNKKRVIQLLAWKYSIFSLTQSYICITYRVLNLCSNVMKRFPDIQTVLDIWSVFSLNCLYVKSSLKYFLQRFLEYKLVHYLPENDGKLHPPEFVPSLEYFEKSLGSLGKFNIKKYPKSSGIYITNIYQYQKYLQICEVTFINISYPLA